MSLSPPHTNSLKRLFKKVRSNTHTKLNSDAALSANHPSQDDLVSWRIPKALDDEPQNASDDEESTPQALLLAKRKSHRRRRDLKASGDWLGIQGANPHTGERDVLTPTSSSDCDMGSREDAHVKELRDRAAKAFREFEDAQTQMAQQKLERMKEKKDQLRASQAKLGWTRRRGEWSSAAEPQLSPIIQSEPENETVEAKAEPTIAPCESVPSSSRLVHPYNITNHLSTSGTYVKQHELSQCGENQSGLLALPARNPPREPKERTTFQEQRPPHPQTAKLPSLKKQEINLRMPGLPQDEGMELDKSAFTFTTTTTGCSGTLIRHQSRPRGKHPSWVASMANGTDRDKEDMVTRTGHSQLPRASLRNPQGRLLPLLPPARLPRYLSLPVCPVPGATLEGAALQRGTLRDYTPNTQFRGSHRLWSNHNFRRTTPSQEHRKSRSCVPSKQQVSLVKTERSGSPSLAGPGLLPEHGGRVAGPRHMLRSPPKVTTSVRLVRTPKQEMKNGTLSQEAEGEVGGAGVWYQRKPAAHSKVAVPQIAARRAMLAVGRTGVAGAGGDTGPHVSRDNEPKAGGWGELAGLLGAVLTGLIVALHGLLASFLSAYMSIAKPMLDEKSAMRIRATRGRLTARDCAMACVLAAMLVLLFLLFWELVVGIEIVASRAVGALARFTVFPGA
ncbi:hypothetical protein GQ53DRAFT_766514 [Thozetella sp. PMI_491]|nr:hypothetical protein GQ53DRAFT_766514 [Thozetella sp. PMI_491]